GGEGGQPICGVITSNPNLTLQGARLFNSSIHKLASPGLKSENVVCITPTATIAQHSPEKSNQQSPQEGQIHNDKHVSIQTGATIALAFATQSDVSLLNDASQQQQHHHHHHHHHHQHHQQQQKDTKEASTEIIPGAKIISPKTVKRKMDDAM
ncbi:forkhead box protein A2-B-like, partial [Apis dorsata]|uniref:forkhead box protein A2-B-like n=1 Tax=Apis dorsata TaxID=7462 RepID=UPI0003DF7FA1